MKLLPLLFLCMAFAIASASIYDQYYEEAKKIAHAMSL